MPAFGFCLGCGQARPKVRSPKCNRLGFHLDPFRFGDPPCGHRGEGGQLRLGFVGAGVGLVGALFVGGAVGFLAKGFGAFLGKAVDLAETGGLITGIPLNPKTEVLFTNTSQREFVFEFLFSPSSVKESESLENIIRTLRFHAAPELLGTNTQTDKGPVANFVGEGTAAAKSFFFVPPSEFDITFYHQGKENTHIPRINTCVLQRIDVGYSPLGVWSTFSNGYPVSVRMMLHFREVEITHKLRVMQGF